MPLTFLKQYIEKHNTIINEIMNPLPFLLFTCSINVIFLGCCCDILEFSEEDEEARPSRGCEDFPSDDFLLNRRCQHQIKTDDPVVYIFHHYSIYNFQPITRCELT